MLKLLYLIMDERKAHLSELYNSIASLSDCHILRLSSDEQSNLKKHLKNVEFSEYDYVVVMLRHKKMMKQARYLKRIPNLVFFEHDAWMNFNKKSGYYKKFTKLYKKLPGVKILSTGFQVAEKLKGLGFNVRFLPKGYDSGLLHNYKAERSIELGFIGSVKSSTYKERIKFLNALADRVDLKTLQTSTAKEYVDSLNEIRFFVSADINFGEYMSKNFEAMACGCILVAHDQGDTENAALGFVSMENVVLYKDIEDCLKKINLLRSNPELASSISAKGQQLAEKHYTLEKIGERFIWELERF